MAVTILVEIKQLWVIYFEIFWWPIWHSQHLTALERSQFMRQRYLRTRFVTLTVQKVYRYWDQYYSMQWRAIGTSTLWIFASTHTQQLAPVFHFHEVGHANTWFRCLKECWHGFCFMDFTLKTSFMAWIMSVEQEICVLQICTLSTVETLIRQI